MWVFVAVGNQDAPNHVAAFHQVGNVGDNHVHSQHIFAGKLDPAVHNDNVVAVLQGHHVLANFAEAAQGDNT